MSSGAGEGRAGIGPVAADRHEENHHQAGLNPVVGGVERRGAPPVDDVERGGQGGVDPQAPGDAAPVGRRQLELQTLPNAYLSGTRLDW